MRMYLYTHTYGYLCGRPHTHVPTCFAASGPGWGSPARLDAPSRRAEPTQTRRAHAGSSRAAAPPAEAPGPGGAGKERGWVCSHRCCSQTCGEGAIFGFKREHPLGQRGSHPACAAAVRAAAHRKYSLAPPPETPQQQKPQTT